MNTKCSTHKHIIENFLVIRTVGIKHHTTNLDKMIKSTLNGSKMVIYFTAVIVLYIFADRIAVSSDGKSQNFLIYRNEFILVNTNL